MTLTQGYIRDILDYDPETGQFMWRYRPSAYQGWNGRYANKPAGGPQSEGYVRIRIGSRSYFAHRLAWLYVHGDWPAEIDHINRDRADNRLANLRLCTRKENLGHAKIQKRNTSGVKGVTWHKKYQKWQVTVGKRWLGYYASLSAAANVRRSAARKVYGEFAD